MLDEEEKEHQQLRATLLQEVSSSFPHTDPAVTTVSTTPIPMSLPVVMSEMNEASSSSLPTNADEEMRRKLDDLRRPVTMEKTEKEEKRDTI